MTCHSGNLGAQSGFWVEEAAAKVTVLSRSDDALTLAADTTWPTSKWTVHVTQC